MQTLFVALACVAIGVCLPFIWFWITASWDKRRRKPRL